MLDCFDSERIYVNSYTIFRQFFQPLKGCTDINWFPCCRLCGKIGVHSCDKEIKIIIDSIPVKGFF